MNNLIQRSITGAIFAFVVLGSIIWDPYAQAIVFSVFMVLGLLEFYNLFSKHSFVQVSKEIGIFIGLFIFSLLVGVSLEWLPQISISIYFSFVFHADFSGNVEKERTPTYQYLRFGFWNYLRCDTLLLNN